MKYGVLYDILCGLWTAETTVGDIREKLNRQVSTTRLLAKHQTSDMKTCVQEHHAYAYSLMFINKGLKYSMSLPPQRVSHW